MYYTMRPVLASAAAAHSAGAAASKAMCALAPWLSRSYIIITITV